MSYALLRPFFYYAHPVSNPILCEIDEKGFVYFPDTDIINHRSRYGGRFVRLVEMTEPEPEPSAAAPQVIDVTLQIVEASTPIEGDAIATDVK